MKELTPKQTYSRFGASYLIGYVAYVALVFIVSLILHAISPQLFASGQARMIISFSILYILGYPFMYMMIKDIPVTEIPKKRLGIGGFLASVCIAYTLMYLTNVTALIVNASIGKLTGRGGTNPIVNAIGNMSPVLQVLVVVILAPIFEELIFRKFLLDRVSRYGEVSAMLLSGFMFGLFHGNLVQFMYASMLGFFFAFIYMRTGRIIYTMILHAIVNGTSTFMSIIMFGDLDLSEMVNYLNNGDMEGYMQFVQNNMATFARAGLIGFAIILIVIVGVILMIVLRKKFRFEHHEGELEKGNRFLTVVGNVGMIVYIIFWVLEIVLTQYGVGLSQLLDRLVG
ncbi:MAG: CPBP family intramembrane metalloprotease [Lachnospiraceae bacterium]|nr:CPBP family intramembrane metalloprotease [Lachnospiraceae bacterium]